MVTDLAGVWLAITLAAATPLWQPPHLFHTSMGRNIRHLPCVSRRTGEAGTCMFAFSCAKLNGTHLGTCIDRFYFGSCCKVPEDVPGGEVDVGVPIEDNSLDGTTARIKPAVTQKPLVTAAPPSSSTQYSSPSTEPSTAGFPGSTQGVSQSTNGAFSGSTLGLISSTNGRPSSTSGFTGTTPGFSSSSTSGFSGSTPGMTITTEGYTGTSQAVNSSPLVSSSVSQGNTHQPTTAPPTFVTWTTIEESTAKPPPISIRPQVSEVSGGTHKPTIVSSTEPSPIPSSERPVVTSTLVIPVSTIRPSVSTSNRPPPSTAHPPISQEPSIPPQPSRPPPSTHRPLTTTNQPPSVTPGVSTQHVPVSTIKPPGSSTAKPITAKPTSPRPQQTTSRPVQSTQRPPIITAKPTGNATRPGTVRPPSKPQQGTQKPGSRPPSGTSKPKPSQKPPSKPVAPKPKPTPKPKPPQKPATAKPTTKPTTTTTTSKPSTTTQTPTSETWVPISVSTHAPSPTLPTTKPTTKRPEPVSSTQTLVTGSGVPGSSESTVAGSTATIALPSVMSTTPSSTNASSTPDYTGMLNMTNYKEVCGRRLFPESRVVGGDKSTFGKWPWQISLRQWRTSTYLHKCGAALLNENWAITAAHCVENVPPSDLLLRLGEHDLSIEDEPFGYQERRVQIVASHPQFDPRTFEYDLALLRFYEPVVFQPNIIPICVPEDDTNFVGTTAFVTGWGRLYEDGPLPSVLQEVSVPVINNTLCETMYRAAGYIEHIPDIFICAGWKKGGFDSCEGDSGGPMVIQRPDKRWLLAGVISWGIGCAEPNQPGVYTRISQFRHWINQILQF